MKLSEKIHDYIRAAFTGLWIQTYELEDCIRELGQYCADEELRFAEWNNELGVRFPLETDDKGIIRWTPSSPLEILKSTRDLVAESQGLYEQGLVALHNFHWYVGTASDGGKKVVQTLQNVLNEGKQTRTFICILSPSLDIPEELKSYFTIVKHDLPDKGEILSLMTSCDTEEGELPTDPADLQFIGDAAAGFTRNAAENAFSLCITRGRREQQLLESDYPDWREWDRTKDRDKLEQLQTEEHISLKRLRFLGNDSGLIDPEILFEEKAKELQKLPGVKLLRDETACFEDLGGLYGIKEFCLKALEKRERKRARAKGISIIGVPGVGKSQFCKALGNETNRPVLHVQIGQLKHENVGRSSANMGRLLDIADHMSPCIMFLDEIEKMMSSLMSSGSPVGGDMYQMLLTWMNDHKTDVFVVCTANRVEDIMQTSPEFFRAGRFNASFFVDMPTEEVKNVIWDIYRRLYELGDQPVPTDTSWTGAEIEGCCDIADLLDIPLETAARQIVPVAITAGERIKWLREWATDKVLSADHIGEVYQANSHSPQPSTGKRRNLGGRKKKNGDQK